MLGIRKQLAVRSTIGAGMRVLGECTFEGGLQIDGTVLGNVSATGEGPSVLVIGEGGSVEGALSADHVVIGGSVVGPVLARELLELQAKAHVQGDVRYKSLEMQQGAVIAGQLRPEITPPPAAPAPRESPLAGGFFGGGAAAPIPAADAEPPREPREPTLDFDPR